MDVQIKSSNILYKHTLYWRKDCMKQFCTSLKRHAKNITDFEKKKNVTVNKGGIKITSTCKRMLNLWTIIFKKFAKEKIYRKVSDHGHYTSKYRDTAHSICNLKFNVPNEIPVVFHNGSNYTSHFIIKN